ncbi:MAG: DUF1684 domain-containing protein [Thermoleophilia bacterium]
MEHPRLQLMDWKRRVSAMYDAVRAAGDDPAAAAGACTAWRAARDELFAGHPQSPLTPDARAGFAGVPYFPHDPALRVAAELEPDRDGPSLILPMSEGVSPRFTRIGFVTVALPVATARLAVFWLDGYGGGLFLPFRDASPDTYGAGRYLLDTVKGADLGTDGDGRLILDFNYAYNPSCSYDPQWSCPLAPPQNRLEVAVEAGERTAPWY